LGERSSEFLFNSIAPIYGLFYERQKKRFFEVIEGVNKELDLKEFKTILDVGCGTGALCSVLNEKGLKVTGIDPAEKMIGGVVYYEVNIIFEEEIEGIKPGMTADIEIEVELKENVIAIPKEALKRRSGNRVVMVRNGKKIEERVVEIGIEGDDYVEILSGLAEGEEIIIREKIE